MAMLDLILLFVENIEYFEGRQRMEILLGILVMLLVLSNVYLMIVMQRRSREPDKNPQIEELRREVAQIQKMFT